MPRARSKSRSSSSVVSASSASTLPQRIRHHMHHHAMLRNYLYSAITATFCFVLLRELGWIGHGQYGGGPVTQPPLATPEPATTTQSTMTTKSVTPKQQTGLSSTTDAVTKQQSNLRSSPPSAPQPIMYTFFEYISSEHKGTQMSDAADTELIETWKTAWKSAGWEPKVLTLKDAKSHPKYQEYVQELRKIPMLGIDGKGGNIVYNQLCFLRWLAMAAVGGGFMSDYDVFPLSRAPATTEPPQNGNFTVYSVVKGSETAGIPCLMSGRSDEWTRMAYAILKNGLEHSQSETMWSDMYALIDMRKNAVYQTRDAVVEGQDVLLQHGWKKEDCRLTQNKLAVHFSHEALVQGHTQPGETAEDRPRVADRFLTMWHQVCVGDAQQ